ncbi:MAG: hypothetical protein QMD77_04305 [Patescibacteria group bacterium]|nr:hypothetical protein [Patescibacteria group bacterium]
MRKKIEISNGVKQNKIFAAVLAVAVAVSGFVFAIPAQTEAAVATNESADNVIGQQNFTSYMPNQDAGPGVDGTKLYMPRNPFFDGEKFFVVDRGNNRVLIYNSIPASDNASADVVIGQASLASGGQANQGGAVGANTLNQPASVFSDGAKLIITDFNNNRVLIYNSIPTANNASADVVIGQADMSGSAANQGGAAGANTLYAPSGILYTGKQLLISDYYNNRVLVYNSLPASNNAAADIVIGQTDMTSNSADQGGAAGANTLEYPQGFFFNGKKLFVADQYNNRVLIYNSIPTANNASADVVIGQQNVTGNLYCQTGNWAGIGANTLAYPRGAIVADQKLIIGDYTSNRVLIYNSFGSQWTITKNHSQTLSGDEKMKVKKKKLEFSGKKTAWKKGRVKVYRDGSLVKNVKIKNSGKWKAKFKDTGSAVKDFVLKYYDSSGTLQMNSETYALGINRGSLVEATLEKAAFEGSSAEKAKKSTGGQSNWKMPEADAVSQ